MAEKNPICNYAGEFKELQSGDTLPGGTGSGDSVKKTYTQASHGFAAGNPIYRKSDSTWVKAKADVATTAEVIGVVESVNGDDFVLVESGYITGLSGGTDGAVGFLSAATAGAITTTEPDPSLYISKPLLTYTGTTTAIVNIMRGMTQAPTDPAPDIMRGRLVYVSTTQIKLQNQPGNQSRLWDNTNGYDRVVARAAEPTLSSTAADMNGDAITYATVYDVFEVFDSPTESHLAVAKWAVSTQGSSVRTAAWVTSTAYKIGQRVSNSGSYYPCLEAHTSETFAIDLAAGKWGPAMTGTGDFLGLDIGDAGYPIYSNTGAWRSYRWLGVAIAYNDTGSKFRNTNQDSSIGNYYNRQPRKHASYNSTPNWTLGTQVAWQEYNNGTGVNHANWVCAVTHAATCFYIEKLSVSSGVTGYTGTSLDGIDPDSPGGVWIAFAISGVTQKVFSINSVSVGPGYHYATEVQSSSGASTTYYGNNANGIFAAWVVEV